jgi:hypothetical protein
MGLLGISVTLLCRTTGGIEDMALYYWSLSGHGFSMLVLWVPSIVLYFLVIENKNILNNKNYRFVFFLGLILFFISQLFILVAYLFPKETQLSRFILTPSSRLMIGFFLVNSFSQVILFFSLSFSLASLLKAEKEKKIRMSLYLGVFVSITFALSAGFSNVFLQRGFWQDEWSDHLWLPLGHFSMQAITMILFHLWSLRFVKDQEQFYKTRIFLYLAYPVFVFLGYIHLLPELFKVNAIGYWDDHYVWIPAISSMFFTVYLSYNAFRFFKKENIFYVLSFLIFSIVGGLTGLKIVTDTLFKTLVLGTLFMPGHFHPLLLGGFSMSMIFYLYEKNLNNLKQVKLKNFLFASLLLGVLSFSSLLMYLGFGRSLRRYPFLVDPKLTFFSWSLFILAGLTIVSLLFLVFRYFYINFRSTSKKNEF